MPPTAKAEDQPRLADRVLYFDEDGQPHAAIVAYVHEHLIGKNGRQTCNLAIFEYSGKFNRRERVEPAYHDGKQWRKINKWAWPEEIPYTIPPFQKHSAWVVSTQPLPDLP